MPSKKKKLCFVLMPFKDEMKEVYWKAIKPAAQEAGFDPLRVDELKGAFNINRKIIEFIFNCDAIVADLTGWNPNVFYEMGVAHAIADKTIMIIQQAEKLPFDVSTYQCIKYEQTTEGLEKLQSKIAEFLLCIADWCKEPTNPVQEFSPYDALVPRSELEEAKKQLRQKEKLLANSAKQAQKLEQELERRPQLVEVLTLKKELEQLASQLNEKQKLLDNSVAQAKYNTLNQELARIRKELDKRPEQAEFLNLKKEADLLRSGLREKEEVEKKLRSELHQIKVTRDEADKKPTAETKIIPPPGMVLIPGGSYTMGKLKKQAAVNPFYLAKFTVTNRLYRKFVEDTKHREPTLWDDKKFNADDQPVVRVSWEDAVAFCDWLTKTNKENRKFRLPTEAEWEWAAGRGERTYPWGNEKLDHDRANYDRKVGYPTPVGSYPSGATPDGLMDMAGNVWEWCADWYDEKKDSRVVRGGSWSLTEDYLSCSFRSWGDPDLRLNYVGFGVSCCA
jgi:serine/threonine-protein kinase